MAKKDPAFLMYSKDWIEGTAELSIEAKGVYIDLLCYQHQKKNLPIDLKILARLVRLSEKEFKPIWEEIKDKFELKNDRFENAKLSSVSTERADKGKKNTIIGIFSGLLRKSKLSKKDYALIRRDFNVDMFMKYNSERISERISEWYIKRLKSIENANANANEDEDIKVDINKFTPPTIEEIESYAKERGYKIDASKIFHYYNEAGWKDSKGSKIKNWKQKINGVWFKDENKIKKISTHYDTEW